MSSGVWKSYVIRFFRSRGWLAQLGKRPLTNPGIWVQNSAANRQDFLYAVAKIIALPWFLRNILMPRKYNQAIYWNSKKQHSLLWEKGTSVSWTNWPLTVADVVRPQSTTATLQNNTVIWWCHKHRPRNAWCNPRLWRNNHVTDQDMGHTGVFEAPR